VFVTAFYSFRLVFMTFHGTERFRNVTTHTDHSTAASSVDHGHASAHSVATPAVSHEPAVSQSAHDGDVHDDHGHAHAVEPRESPWVVTLPLVLLAIPSLFIGWFTIGPVLFGDYFDGALFVKEQHDVLAHLGEEFHGPGQFVLHAAQSLPVYLALAGVFFAWLFYIKKPDIPGKIAARFAIIYKLLANKFYFDEIYQFVFAGGSRALGTALWRVGDVALIDGTLVNGSARVVGWLSGVMRHLQSGYLYHYAFAMIIGLSALLAWYVLR
jgi:NADH-quinone oxidoreductase subunit L